MDTRVVKEVIAVIKAERDRRTTSMADADPAFAYDQWLFYDEPFVNELCLMLLVSIHHQVERELVRLAARISADGREISGEQYRQRVKAERESLKQQGGPKKLREALKLESCNEWKCAEALRLLANCYKHGPFEKPEDSLLRHLNLDPSANYAALPDSHCFREGLAAWLNLAKDADYCDISEKMLERATEFLADVPRLTVLSPVAPGCVSLSPDDAEC